MAYTDPGDILEGERSGRRWSFAGWLNGVRAAFGLGGKNILNVSPNGPDAPLLTDTMLKEVQLAKKSIQMSGDKFWTRMSSSEAKLKMWRNDFGPEVDRKLRANFHPENWRRMTLMMHTSTNLLQRLVTEISLTYENPPRRFFKDELENQEDKTVQVEPNLPVPTEPPAKNAPVVPSLNTGQPNIDALADQLDLEGAEKPADTDILQKLCSMTNIDMVMENVEMMSRFLPCVWVRPMVDYDRAIVTKKVNDAGEEYAETSDDPSSGRLYFRIYTPDLADVVVDPDDPCKAIAFWYYSYDLNSRGEMAKFINFWTDDNYIKLDDTWRVVLLETNPYGMLPVVPIRLGLSNTYYLDGQGDDIYEGSLEICVLKTIQNARARDAGFKQIAMTGDPKDVPADQVLGGPNVFYTGEGGSVSVLDVQPYIDQWTALCKERGMELAAKYGISASSYKAEGTPQSGFAKKLDMGKVLSINRRGRKYFKQAEIDLYKLTRVVVGARPVPALGELPDREFDIDFAEPAFEEDPKEQAQTDAQRIKLNIDSILDVLKRENPDLSELELLELAAKKKRINDAFITKTASTLLDLLASTGKGVNPQAATELGAPAVGGPAPGGGGGKPPFSK